MIPKSLKLDFIGYFLKTMNEMAKVTTSLSTLSKELGISVEGLNKLLTALRDEDIIAFSRLGVYEAQEMQYFFALKTNSQTEELLLLYQNQNKKHENKEANRD